jgi:hypothetical protein
MAKFSRQKRHLRQLAREKLTIPRENVVYVPVVKGVNLDELPTDQQVSRDEWNEIFAEPDSDYDAETDEENWSNQLEVDKAWVDLQRQMQSAASSVQPSRRYHGTSRTTLFRRKKASQKASEGTSSLFSFGFVKSRPSCEVEPNVDVDMEIEPGTVGGPQILVMFFS